MKRILKQIGGIILAPAHYLYQGCAWVLSKNAIAITLTVIWFLYALFIVINNGLPQSVWEVIVLIFAFVMITGAALPIISALLNFVFVAICIILKPLSKLYEACTRTATEWKFYYAQKELEDIEKFQDKYGLDVARKKAQEKRRRREARLEKIIHKEQTNRQKKPFTKNADILEYYKIKDTRIPIKDYENNIPIWWLITHKNFSYFAIGRKQ